MNSLDYVYILFYIIVGVFMVIGSKSTVLMLESFQYKNKDLFTWLKNEYKRVYDLPLTFSFLFFIAVLIINIFAKADSLINPLLHWLLMVVYSMLIIYYSKTIKPDISKNTLIYTPKNKLLLVGLVLFYLFTAAEIYFVDIILLGNTFLKGSFIFTIILLIGNGVANANLLVKPIEFLIKKRSQKTDA